MTSIQPIKVNDLRIGDVWSRMQNGERAVSLTLAGTEGIRRLIEQLSYAVDEYGGDEIQGVELIGLFKALRDGAVEPEPDTMLKALATAQRFWADRIEQARREFADSGANLVPRGEALDLTHAGTVLAVLHPVRGVGVRAWAAAGVDEPFLSPEDAAATYMWNAGMLGTRPAKVDGPEEVTTYSLGPVVVGEPEEPSVEAVPAEVVAAYGRSGTRLVWISDTERDLFHGGHSLVRILKQSDPKYRGRWAVESGEGTYTLPAEAAAAWMWRQGLLGPVEAEVVEAAPVERFVLRLPLPLTNQEVSVVRQVVLPGRPVKYHVRRTALVGSEVAQWTESGRTVVGREKALAIAHDLYLDTCKYLARATVKHEVGRVPEGW